MCAVVLAKDAVTQEEILNPTLEPITQITSDQKIQNEKNKIQNEKNTQKEIDDIKKQEILNRKIEASNLITSEQVMDENPTSIISTQENIDMEKNRT